MARTHFGGESVESGSSVRVDSSASRINSLHSASVIRFSTIAANWPLNAGMGGFVFSKLSLRRVAFGGGPRRKSFGIWPSVIVAF